MKKLCFYISAADPDSVRHRTISRIRSRNAKEAQEMHVSIKTVFQFYVVSIFSHQNWGLDPDPDPPIAQLVSDPT
jgi:hypothetical protein